MAPGSLPGIHTIATVPDRPDGGGQAAGGDVRTVVAAFLRLDPAAIDPHTPLTAYGLDSLGALELVATLEDSFGCRLPEWLLSERPDLARLTALLQGRHGVRHASPDVRDGEERYADSGARARLLADATLPPDIVPPAAGSRDAGVRPVLLTGATGFLGAWLARTLLDKGREVICLVRAKAGQAPLDRVVTNLQRYGLWQVDDGRRITAIGGDLCTRQLGLTSEAWLALADHVGDIYHAAAEVNWVAAYDGLRSPNVLGTTELLRVACAAGRGTFHFVSSLSVLFAADGPSVVTEDDTMLPYVERLPLGYAQSKCVAEALVREAAARGLRARIYRPALLAGDSTTGASNVDDLTAALIKGCIRMGAAPDLDWVFDAVPVDTAARAIVRLGRRTPAPLETFHVRHPRPRHWRECVLWTNLFGYEVRLEPYDRWLDRLRCDAVAADHPLHRLRGFFARRWSGRSTAELYEESRRSRVDSVRARAVERAAAIAYPPLDAARLDAYVSDYVARGFLPPPAVARTGHGRHDPDGQPGRGRRVLQDLLREHFGDASLDVTDVSLMSSGSEHSIVSELTAWRRKGRAGLFHYRVGLRGRRGVHALDLVAKVKPPDEDVMEVAETLARVCDEGVYRALLPVRERLGIRGGQRREVEIYRCRGDARLRAHMPGFYGTWREEDAALTGVLLERLTGMALIDSADDVRAWTPPCVHAAIDGLAVLHAAGMELAADVAPTPWIGYVPDASGAAAMVPFWGALAAHAAAMFELWAGPSLPRRHRNLLEATDAWWPALDAAPRTLIHHDCNSRNVALRHTAGGLQLVAYDWELATIGAPQRDLAELLCFVLPPDVDAATVGTLVERHRVALERASGVRLPAAAWREGFRSALADLLVSRLAFYALIHRVRPQRFLPRVVATWHHLAGAGVRS